MKSKKILILVPDGVSLRNFLFTDFPKKAEALGLEVVYWNATSYNIVSEGYSEIKLKPEVRTITDLYKRAKIISELDHFQLKFQDPVYEKYKFPASKKGWKNKLKNLIVSRLSSTYSGEEGLQVLQKRMEDSERKSAYYQNSKKTLEKECPDLVLCANQRPVNAIAPIIAARDLGIPTGCFIFSWDNLPKATKVIDADHYFVWSQYMQNELQKYYPYTGKERITISGSPQFEIHYKKDILQSRDEFFRKNGLDSFKDYICYSGDDITTSPHDEIFLKDVAQAVRILNQQGNNNIGIIFRRCPVDFSNRYEDVLRKYSGEITPIDPLWSGGNDSWDVAMPTKEDLILQTNIVQHCFMVINIASSMVFDFAARNKPCAYVNYVPEVKEGLKKDVREIYDYVHFRSMENKKAVHWINKKEEISSVIRQCQKENSNMLEICRSWQNIINYQSDRASLNLAKSILQLIERS